MVRKRLLGLVLVVLLAFSGLSMSASATGEKAETTQAPADVETGGEVSVIAETDGAQPIAEASEAESEIVEVETITLDPIETNIEVGKTVTLKATVTPDNAADQTLTWSTSNGNVATVDSGKVTAKAVGTATITVTSSNGKKAECAVTVEPIAVTGVKLNKTTAAVVKGKTLTLKTTITPGDAADKTLDWTSSNEKVATVDDSGKVTAKSVGAATITVKSKVNTKITATCKVTVNPAAPALKKVTSVAYDKLKITWSKASDADGYYVYRKENGDWKKVKTIKSGATTTYTHSGSTIGYNKKYTYDVCAWKEVDGKKYTSSHHSSGISGKTVLIQPKLVSVKNVSSTSMKLTWKKTADAQGYVVLYKKAGSGKWEEVATIKNAKTKTYTIKKLAAGTKYTYTVKAYRKISGKTYYSSYDKTGVSKLYLKAPTLSSVKVSVGKGIKVTWAEVKGATSYVVYRKNAGSSSWSSLATVSGGSKVSYLDTTVKKGKSYVYTVRAKAKNADTSSCNQNGYYCVYSTDPAYSYAANVINKITTSSMTNLEKLRACHRWFNQPYRYITNREIPDYLSGTKWISQYAQYYFRNHGGNCYRHACAYAYLAKTLGYQPKLVTGRLCGTMYHGWIEIKINGTTYIFDSQWEYSNRHRGRAVNLFQRTYGNYPFSLKAQHRYSIPE